MKKTIILSLIGFLAACEGPENSNQVFNSGGIKTSQTPLFSVDNFQNPPASVRPKYRYWVTVADMEDTEIISELNDMHSAGAGGLEVVMFPGDSTEPEYLRKYGFGGPEWNHKVELLHTTAAKLGMSVDQTVSPGWPGSKVVAGATEPYSIDDPAVAKKLVYGRTLLSSGQHIDVELPDPVIEKVTMPFGPPPGMDFGPDGMPLGADGFMGPPEDGSGGAPFEPPGASAEARQNARKAIINVSAVQCISRCDSTGTAELDFSSQIDLTDKVVDGKFTVELPVGNGQSWQLIVLYSTADGATASHAYTSPAYIVDHLSREGVFAYRDFWTSRVFGNNPNALFNSEATQQAINKTGAAMFEDSLELSASVKWTPKMLQMWQQLRGYDVSPYLSVLAGIGRQGDQQGPFAFDADIDQRIRNDYRQTWSDLYITEHLETMREWLAPLGMETRLQAYGDPIVVPSAMAHVDIPEGECNMGFPEVGKFIAVGAHMQTGRTVVSSENCAIPAAAWNTTLGGTGKTSNLAAAYRTYAGGVTQQVWHGFSYKTTDAGNGSERVWPWHAGFNHVAPGWGETWAPVMPQWQAGHVRQTNDNLARLSLVTRQGKPRFDLAFYWHGYGIGSNGGTRPELESRITSDGVLAEHGYTHEYITDEFIVDQSYGGIYQRDTNLNNGAYFPDKSAYKALVLNNIPTMALATAKRIYQLAHDEKLPVIIVGELPDKVPGFFEYQQQEQQLFATLNDTSEDAMKRKSSLLSLVDDPIYKVRKVRTLSNIDNVLRDMGIRPAVEHVKAPGINKDSAILSLRRQTAEVDYYLFFNQTSAQASQRIKLAGRGIPYRLDTWTGQITPVAEYDVVPGGVVVDISLAGQNIMALALSHEPLDGQAKPEQHAPLNDLMDVSFTYQTAGQLIKMTSDMVDVQSLRVWDLTVESFTSKGDSPENSLPGIANTLRTKIEIGEVLANEGSALLPAWSQINPDKGYSADLGDISGIGHYKTQIDVPLGWNNGRGAWLDLGQATDSVSLAINGQLLPPLDQQDLSHIDIGPYLKAGRNDVEVIVATTLINAVRVAPGTQAQRRLKNDKYGLLGPVSVSFYQYNTLQN